MSESELKSLILLLRDDIKSMHEDMIRMMVRLSDSVIKQVGKINDKRH